MRKDIAVATIPQLGPMIFSRAACEGPAVAPLALDSVKAVNREIYNAQSVLCAKA